MAEASAGTSRSNAHLGRKRIEYAVQLTPKGKRAFDTMAAEHERWVEDLLSGLTRTERDRLYTLLGRLKTTIRERDFGAPPALKEKRA